MERVPGAVFVIDPKREELLVKEANRLQIPVVALTDTNCDPDVVDYVIPGNDDAIRAISLISRLVADAIVEGRGEEAPPSEDRPVPPVLEEAQVTEEATEDVAQTPDEGPETEETPSEVPEAQAPETRDVEEPDDAAEADEPDTAGDEGAEAEPPDEEHSETEEK
jgi:small subunit ribosomal protein S2